MFDKLIPALLAGAMLLASSAHSQTVGNIGDMPSTPPQTSEPNLAAQFYMPLDSKFALEDNTISVEIHPSCPGIEPTQFMIEYKMCIVFTVINVTPETKFSFDQDLNVVTETRDIPIYYVWHLIPAQEYSDTSKWPMFWKNGNAMRERGGNPAMFDPNNGKGTEVIVRHGWPNVLVYPFDHTNY